MIQKASETKIVGTPAILPFHADGDTVKVTPTTRFLDVRSSADRNNVRFTGTSRAVTPNLYAHNCTEFKIQYNPNTPVPLNRISIEDFRKGSNVLISGHRLIDSGFTSANVGYDTYAFDIDTTNSDGYDTTSYKLIYVNTAQTVETGTVKWKANAGVHAGSVTTPIGVETSIIINPNIDYFVLTFYDFAGATVISYPTLLQYDNLTGTNIAEILGIACINPHSALSKSSPLVKTVSPNSQYDGQYTAMDNIVSDPGNLNQSVPVNLRTLNKDTSNEMFISGAFRVTDICSTNYDGYTILSDALAVFKPVAQSIGSNSYPYYINKLITNTLHEDLQAVESGMFQMQVGRKDGEYLSFIVSQNVSNPVNIDDPIVDFSKCVAIPSIQFKDPQAFEDVTIMQDLSEINSWYAKFVFVSPTKTPTEIANLTGNEISQISVLFLSAPNSSIVNLKKYATISNPNVFEINFQKSTAAATKPLVSKPRLVDGDNAYGLNVLEILPSTDYSTNATVTLRVGINGSIATGTRLVIFSPISYDVTDIQSKQIGVGTNNTTSPMIVYSGTAALDYWDIVIPNLSQTFNFMVLPMTNATGVSQISAITSYYGDANPPTNNMNVNYVGNTTTGQLFAIVEQNWLDDSSLFGRSSIASDTFSETMTIQDARANSGYVGGSDSIYSNIDSQSDRMPLQYSVAFEKSQVVWYGTSQVLAPPSLNGFQLILDQPNMRYLVKWTGDTAVGYFSKNRLVCSALTNQAGVELVVDQNSNNPYENTIYIKIVGTTSWSSVLGIAFISMPVAPHTSSNDDLYVTSITQLFTKVTANATTPVFEMQTIAGSQGIVATTPATLISNTTQAIFEITLTGTEIVSEPNAYHLYIKGGVLVTGAGASTGYNTVVGDPSSTDVNIAYGIIDVPSQVSRGDVKFRVVVPNTDAFSQLLIMKIKRLDDTDPTDYLIARVSGMFSKAGTNPNKYYGSLYASGDPVAINFNGLSDPVACVVSDSIFNRLGVLNSGSNITNSRNAGIHEGEPLCFAFNPIDESNNTWTEVGSNTIVFSQEYLVAQAYNSADGVQATQPFNSVGNKVVAAYTSATSQLDVSRTNPLINLGQLLGVPMAIVDTVSRQANHSQIITYSNTANVSESAVTYKLSATAPAISGYSISYFAVPPFYSQNNLTTYYNGLITVAFTKPTVSAGTDAQLVCTNLSSNMPFSFTVDTGTPIEAFGSDGLPTTDFLDASIISFPITVGFTDTDYDVAGAYFKSFQKSFTTPTLAKGIIIGKPTAASTLPTKTQVWISVHGRDSFEGVIDVAMIVDQESVTIAGKTIYANTTSVSGANSTGVTIHGSAIASIVANGWYDSVNQAFQNANVPIDQTLKINPNAPFNAYVCTDLYGTVPLSVKHDPRCKVVAKPRKLI